MLADLSWKYSRQWGALLLAITVSLVGCDAGEQVSSADHRTAAPVKPKVVASHSILCDLTEAIAQETIDLNCLIGPGQDPHEYQPTPATRRAIDTAQLVLYGGYNFEPAVIDLVKASQNPAPKIAVDELAVPQPLMAVQTHGSEEVQAAAAGEPDPHIWHDAQNGIRMIEVIRSHLEQLAPAEAELYAQNAQALTAQLQQVDAWIKAQVATIPVGQRQLITTHDALGYYANAYGFEVSESLLGLSTNDRPTAARVKELVAEIQATGVPTLFAEATTSDRVLHTIAREANVKIAEQGLYADGLGSEGSTAGSYVGMLAYNTCVIVTGLGGRCTPLK